MNTRHDNLFSWSEDTLERVTQCPVCRNSERLLLHNGLTDRLFGTPGIWTLYRCVTCSSAYMDPRPTLSSISVAYSSYHTHKAPDDSIPPTGHIKKLKLLLKNSYLNNTYGTRFRPSHQILGWIALLLPQKRHLDEQMRHLPQNLNNGTLLDIGCGNGDFLRNAHQLGWNTYGIDPDPKAVDVAKNTGGIVREGGLPNTDLPSEHFDIVTMSHVIEHLHDPAAAMKEAFRLVKPGGQIWLATPNLESSGHALFGPHWRGLEPPRHLVLFTRSSLTLLLESAGFSSIQYKPCVPTATWFYQSSFCISQGGNPNNNDEKRIMPLRLRWAAKLANLRAMTISSNCEVLMVMAQRGADPMPIKHCRD